MKTGAVFLASFAGLWGLLLVGGSLADAAIYSGYGKQIGSGIIIACLLGLPLLIAYALHSDKSS